MRTTSSTLSVVVLMTVGLACQHVSDAADYYVSPSGRDANAGTRDAPFRSLYRGVTAAVNPGDQIILREGRYAPRATVNLARSGTAEQPIVLRGMAGETAVVDGKNMGERANTIGVLGHDIRIENITVENSRGSGIAVYGRGTRVYDVAVVGCRAKNCYLSGLYAGSPSLQDPVSGVLFEDNFVEYASLQNEGGRTQNWAFSIGAGLSRDVTIRGNKVSNGYGEGVGLYLSDGGLIEGNDVRDCFSVNVYLDNATNTTVSRNFVTSSGDERFFRFGRRAIGFMIANENYGRLLNSSENNTIINNVLVDNDVNLAYGNYQNGGGLRDTTFAHNTSVNRVGRGLRINPDAGHTKSLVANNIFVQRGREAITEFAGSVDGIAFRNNLWSGGFVDVAAQSATDLSGDPQFLNQDGAGPEDYMIRNDSIAARAAERIGAALFDFRRQERASSCSMGAFEAARR